MRNREEHEEISGRKVSYLSKLLAILDLLYG